MCLLHCTELCFLELGTNALLFYLCFCNKSDEFSAKSDEIFSPRKLAKTMKCAIKKLKIHCFQDVHLNHPLIAFGWLQVFSSSMLSPSSNVFHKCPNTKAYDYTPWEGVSWASWWLKQSDLFKTHFEPYGFPDSFTPWQPTPPLPDSSPTHEIRSKQHYTNLSAIPHQSGTLKLGQRGRGRGGRKGKGAGWTCR